MMIIYDDDMMMIYQAARGIVAAEIYVDLAGAC
jgi:hypothetical protein